MPQFCLYQKDPELRGETMMKRAHQVMTRVGFAFGLALLAGSAQGQEPCPFGRDCFPPPECLPGKSCGPVDPGTVTGSFVKQKPNLTCVYDCSGQKTCTNVNFDCTVSAPFQQTAYFPARVHGYGLNQCPQDQETATALCRLESKNQ
jgi:hypothetical protein